MELFQGAKKLIFTASCHSGKLKLAFTSLDFISTSPKSFLTTRIGFTVLLLFEFLKKHHLPVGQVKNRIHQSDSKIHQPRAIGHDFLCTSLVFVYCQWFCYKETYLALKLVTFQLLSFGTNSCRSFHMFPQESSQGFTKRNLTEKGKFCCTALFPIHRVRFYKPVKQLKKNHVLIQSCMRDLLFPGLFESATLSVSYTGKNPIV